MSIKNCRNIDLPKVSDPRGNLSFIEGRKHIPLIFPECIISMMFQKDLSVVVMHIGLYISLFLQWLDRLKCI